MWLLHFFKNTISSSLNELATKNKGRLKFYILFYLLATLVSLILVFCCVYVVLYFKTGYNPDVGVFASTITTGTFAFIYFPASVLTVIFVMKYKLYLQDQEENRHTLSGMFARIDTGTVIFYIIAAVICTVISAYYFINTDPYYGSSYDIGMYGEKINSWGNEWIREAVYAFMRTLVEVLPLAILGYYGMMLRKRQSSVFKIAPWKPILGFVILAMIIIVVHNRFYQLLNELILNILYAPFDSVEIPIFFTVLVAGFFNVIYVMVLSTFAHYAFEYKKDDSQKHVIRNETTDLLDQ